MSSRPDKARARSQQPADVLTCGVCGRSFSRSEHLKRHELTHSNDKPFECSTCGKGFMRKDALDRHASTHTVSGPSLRQKGARACSNCAASKVKCSGELPSCARCRNRAGAQCDYPSVSMTTVENHRAIDNESTPFSSVTPAGSFADREMQLGSPNSRMPTDNAEVPGGMQTLDPMTMSHFDQGFWNHELESTINWLPDGNRFQLDDYVMDHLDDDTFFPFLDTAAQGDTSSFNQFMPPAVSSSPGRASLDQPTQGTSVNHASNRSTTSAQTPLSVQSLTADQQHVEGELYVDGQPARLPRVKRRRLTESTFVASPGAIDTFSLRCPPFNLAEDQPHLNLTLSDRTFDELYEAFQTSCTRTGYMQDNRSTNTQNTTRFRALFPTPFEPDFPSKEDFRLLLHSYVTNFHPTMPIFHVTAFERFDWQLVLVSSAIGALFLNRTEEHAHFAASLQEFLRRVLYLAEEDSNWLPQSTTVRGQLKLLNVILMTYTCPIQDWKDLRPIDHLPTNFCRSHASLHSPQSQPTEQSVQEWEDWKMVETRNRLGYATWLVDCMIAIHLQRKPLLTLECASLSLPCHEDLWQCSSLNAWLELRTRFAGVGSMNDALQEIYVHKRLDRRLGEFSRILILHGLFHRMWEVGAYLSHPLSQWTPTARKPSDQRLSVDSSIWLPSVPTFARWRNATCDCIDILHWSANAAIGVASGMEHPTVLHLHFSRVVLLTPYKQIVAVAKHLVRTDSAVNLADVGSDKQIIRRWAIQDQYKARLAMIHAGVLFWHVRRYSTNGFYEPVSVALASLALWAFSLFSDKSRTSKSDNTVHLDAHVDRGDSEAEEARCDLILLDRPTDDELVQQYVKEGHKMSAILNGVGDLRGSTGPERVLTEGRKLLKTLALWGISGHWISLFDKLIAISRRQREVSSVDSRET